MNIVFSQDLFTVGSAEFCWIDCEMTSVQLESSGFPCASGVDVFIECFQDLLLLLRLPPSTPSLDDKNNLVFRYVL